MSRRKHKRPLNIRQQRFVDEYLITGSGREAAIRAGYSPHSATDIAVYLRKLPHVAQAIHLRRAAAGRRTQVARDRVLMELARVAFSDIGEILDWESGDDITLRPKVEISPHDRAAIAEIAPRRYGKGPRIKLHNKAHALDAIARHLGLFDKQVLAVPPPDARRPGRDARTILLERLKRLARAPDQDTASLDAGAPLGIPVFENSVVMPGHDVTNEFSPAASPPPVPSPSRGEGQGGGEARHHAEPPSPDRTFPPGFPLPPK
ncbi:MAG: terminase small subunit [Alphaproteobacteria bacterium]|nr:terminase small subunit [Alphaproteobacteria bacterium]